jgi:hypothetical protein
VHRLRRLYRIEVVAPEYSKLSVRSSASAKRVLKLRLAGNSSWKPGEGLERHHRDLLVAREKGQKPVVAVQESQEVLSRTIVVLLRTEGL